MRPSFDSRNMAGVKSKGYQTRSLVDDHRARESYEAESTGPRRAQVDAQKGMKYMYYRSK